MKVQFLNEEGDFLLEDADASSYLYFPIANESGIMGSVTPRLHGDLKTGQNTFLLEPVCAGQLNNMDAPRNLWLRIGDDIWAVNGCSPDQQAEKRKAWLKEDKIEEGEIEQNQEGKAEPNETVTVTAGKLWHKVTRTNIKYGIKAEVLSFAPVSFQAEVMKVTLTNEGFEERRIQATTAVPIYARSAENIRDHRHVTSLLNRLYVKPFGIEVKPTLSFDERGHRKNEEVYGVYAKGQDGEIPIRFFPVMDDWIGEGGTLSMPAGMYREDRKGGQSEEHIGKEEKEKGKQQEKEAQEQEEQEAQEAAEEYEIDGYEAIGAMRFRKRILKPGESYSYTILLSFNRSGISLLDQDIRPYLEETKRFWEEQSSIRTKTGDSSYDLWLGWVGIQPALRRIYGCSFLPHHDYGRGGRGYRDLWQDSLALILLSPHSIRENLISYFGGVRMDGSNATIIGTEPGSFIADRNSIVRMWMDHGVWPLITTNLYVNQTGDIEILLEERSYFKDGIAGRGSRRDALWDGVTKEVQTYGSKVYYGTILEHILIQHVTACLDVGEHGHLKLCGGDWNDALDMAKERGESVAFSAAYAGNLERIVELLHCLYKKRGRKEVMLSTELCCLLEGAVGLEDYMKSCSSYVSGEKKQVEIQWLCENLHHRAEQIKMRIQKTEWLQEEPGIGWFNSYYDNHGRKVEGIRETACIRKTNCIKKMDGLEKTEPRMMLTGQVFTIMSHTASDEQVAQIVRAADRYLLNPQIGGYRLNTDFHELKIDLGRMFGFAYGTKENGSVFSHMAVMYAYALYERGFVKEGYRAVNLLYKQAMNFEKSRIYPGIPEYFDMRGRGMYHYLTGAASWYMLTVLTQMFGVKGRCGDLILEPKLLAGQFDEQHKACIHSYFAGKRIMVEYSNPYEKEVGDYEIEEGTLDGTMLSIVNGRLVIAKEELEQLDSKEEHLILVKLC